MDGINVKNQRDIYNLKNNIISVFMELKKLFKKNNIKVRIRNKEYNVIGRLGMFHIVVDITGADIKENENVYIESAPIYINPNIRREYI